MASKTGDEIARLEKMHRKDLAKEWSTFYGRWPPKDLGRLLLIRSIAYKIQERSQKGLNKSSREKLDTMIRAYEKNPDKNLPPRIVLTPGTRIMRSWKDELHEVIVREDGFEYRGKIYKSLTGISKTISGCHYPGPSFFGLKNRKKKPLVMCA